jgi:hypothetical protein
MEKLRQVDIEKPPELYPGGESYYDPFFFTTEAYRKLVDTTQNFIFEGNGSDIFSGLTEIPYEQAADRIDQYDRHIAESDMEYERQLDIRFALKDIRGRLDALEIARQSISHPVTLSLILPAYDETRRMLPREPHSNPYGEDALRYKLARMQEYLDEARAIVPDMDLNIRFLVVDDGDPNGESGRLAGEIAEEWRQSEIALRGPGSENEVIETRVSYLRDDIDDAYANQSRKGGSVVNGINCLTTPENLGGWGIDETERNHVIIENDFDVAIPVGGIVSVALPVVRRDQGMEVAAANRRMEGSVTVSDPERDKRSRLFKGLINLMYPAFAEVNADVNRGLKAMSANAALNIAAHIADTTFTYQVELLALAARDHGGFVNVPVGFADSEPESKQKSGDEMAQSYSDQMRRALAAAERLGQIDLSSAAVLSRVIQIIANGRDSDHKIERIVQDPAVHHILSAFEYLQDKRSSRHSLIDILLGQIGHLQDEPK